MSLANNSGFDAKFSDKSLIYIKNNSGPGIEFDLVFSEDLGAIPNAFDVSRNNPVLRSNHQMIRIFCD